MVGQPVSVVVVAADQKRLTVVHGASSWGSSVAVEQGCWYAAVVVSLARQVVLLAVVSLFGERSSTVAVGNSEGPLQVAVVVAVVEPAAGIELSVLRYIVVVVAELAELHEHFVVVRLMAPVMVVDHQHCIAAVVESVDTEQLVAVESAEHHTAAAAAVDTGYPAVVVVVAAVDLESPVASENEQ
jgi:hypothetical protein